MKSVKIWWIHEEQRYEGTFEYEEIEDGLFQAYTRDSKGDAFESGVITQDELENVLSVIEPDGDITGYNLIEGL